MKECPVCKSFYEQEVNICKRCNLSEDNITHINKISPDNPILNICIPTLINKLKKYEEKERHIQKLVNISQLEIKVKNLINDQKQDRQEIENLKNIVEELQSKIQSKDDPYSQDLDTQETLESSTQVQPQELTVHSTLTNPNSRSDGNTEDNKVDVPNDRKVDNNDSDLPASQESDFCDETGQSKFSQTIDTQTPQFVETYNKDKNLFDEYTISTVTETKDSRDNRLVGRSETVFLSSISKGNYWIVEENNKFYLVPHAKISINEHNKRYTIENLFECDEPSSGDYIFKLIQPAKIFKVNSELWQIKKKGKLEFF